MRVRSRTLIPRKGGSIPWPYIGRVESCRRRSAIPTPVDQVRLAAVERAPRLLMATPTSTSTELTDLLPSTPYRLVYALPLLALSTLLAFAGAFLTLDRTRSFRPRRDPLDVPGSFGFTKRPRQVHFYLQGGLGGLSMGYSFGRTFICLLCNIVTENIPVHLTTFLALVIPNESTSAPLGPKSFLAVWVLTSIPFAIFSGLFEYAALALTGITGG